MRKHILAGKLGRSAVWVFLVKEKGEKKGNARRMFKFQFDSAELDVCQRDQCHAESAGTGSNWRSRLRGPHRLLIRYSNQNTWREYSLLANSRCTYATPRASFALIGSVIVITLALQKSIFKVRPWETSSTLHRHCVNWMNLSVYFVDI